MIENRLSIPHCVISRRWHCGPKTAAGRSHHGQICRLFGGMQQNASVQAKHSTCTMSCILETIFSHLSSISMGTFPEAKMASRRHPQKRIVCVFQKNLAVHHVVVLITSLATKQSKTTTTKINKTSKTKSFRNIKTTVK